MPAPPVSASRGAAPVATGSRSTRSPGHPGGPVGTGDPRPNSSSTPSAVRPQRRWAWLCLALGVALMTGVQLAEARTVTGTGDFAVAATPPAAAATSSGAPSSSPATSGAAVSSAVSSGAAPTSTPATSAPTTPSPDGSPATAAALAPAASAAPSSDAAGPPAESVTDTSPAPEAAPPADVPTSEAPVGAGIPVDFALPRLDVQAPIDPVGLTDGELEVPEDIRRLGWWTGSAAAGGSSGTTVIDGHIDSPQGRGVFYHLQEVQPDDQVVLTVAGGGTATYRVTERRSYVKADGLPPEVFATSDQPRLVLITCGGRYDFAKASYDDNIVVIAVPA